MGCAASKAPPKRDPVEELIEEVHAQQGRESGGGVTLDLSAAPASADAPAGKLCELGLSLGGKVPDAAWACVGVTTCVDTNQCVGITDVAALAPSSGEEPTSPVTPSSRGRFDGVEVDAAIQDELSTQVTTLSLKGNHLGSLSPKLAQLSALRVLDVSENGLTALPEGVAARAGFA